MASCRDGSKTAPTSSRRAKPSRCTTPAAWSRTARTPSMMTAGSASACASARSRLSSTGSHSAATRARSSDRARSMSRAHRLRVLSRSARARSRWSASSAIRACSASRAGSEPPGPPGDGGPPGDDGSPRPGRGSLSPGWSLMSRELRVDHVIVAGSLAGGACCGWARTRPARAGGPGHAEALVDLLELAGQRPEPVERRLIGDGLPRIGDQRLGPGLLVHGQRAAALGDYAFHLVGHGIKLVAGVGQLTQPTVVGTVLLGVRDHLVYLGLVQVGALADGDALLRLGVLVPGGNVQDAVRVDVVGDLDLRLAAGGGPDVLQPEPAEHAVVGRPLTLALEHHDVDGALVVLGRAEHLGAAGRNRGVALDDLGHDPAERLDAEGQRRDIKQQHV